MDKKQWFRERKWGVFFHYLHGSMNTANSLRSMGKETSWEECVNDFDVKFVAEQLHEINAGYLGITIMQATKHMIAPNETYHRLLDYDPRYKTGVACSSRDLIADLINALGKYDIPLFLYFTGDGPFFDDDAWFKLGGIMKEDGKRVLPDKFVDNWTSVLREYSLRYGDGIKGWWLDGMFEGFFPGIEHPGISKFKDAALSGNSNALFAANYYGCGREIYRRELGNYGKMLIGDWYHKIMPPTKFCDYTAGELNQFDAYPEQFEIEGAVPHVMSFLGIPRIPVETHAGWGKPGSKYTPEYMRGYVECVNHLGGVVTIDCAVYRDGHIDEEQMKVFRALKEIRG